MVSLILICLIIALILSGLWLYNAQECIKSGVQLSSRQDSRHVADQIGAFIGKYEAYASAVALDQNTVDGIISKDAEKLKLTADRLQANVPQADFIQIADDSGAVIYGTKPSNITNLGTYAWYGGAADKRMPYVTGLYYSLVSGKDVFSILSPIEDNGPGIPDELKDKIFNRMSRGDTRARGSGLGLYLVRTLVESYNGKVWVEDRVPGDYKQGSKFVILLPAVD